MQAPSWRLVLRALAVLSWLVSVIWFLASPGPEPLLAFLAGVTALITSFSVPSTRIGQPTPYSPTPFQRTQNRSRMLRRVDDTWVKGVLELSLHGAEPLDLDMVQRPPAVRQDLDESGTRTARPPLTKEKSSRILELFDQTEGSLLIMGEPGSGKTTVLLTLARELVARTQPDGPQPLPVVFKLSSWADKSLPLADWIVDELTKQYRVPRKIGRAWIEGDELLPLLDGLDEIPEEERQACVEAINEFYALHMVDVVVSCRTVDYEILDRGLDFQWAVALEALTSRQIAAYLSGPNTELLAVRKSLEADRKLDELARLPLFLSMMTLVYRDMSLEELRLFDAAEDRRECLLDSFVRRMTSKVEQKGNWSAEQSIGWLSALAGVMARRNSTVFQIEDLQANDFGQDTTSRMGAIGLLLGVAASATTLFVGQVLLSPNVTSLFRIEILNTLSTCGLWSGAAMYLLMLALFGWAWFQDEIKPVEQLTWSWQSVKRRMRFFFVDLSPGATVLMYVLSGAMFLFGLLAGGAEFVSAAQFCIAVWLAMVLVLIIVSGLDTGMLETKAYPNEGIRRSAWNAVLTACLGGALGGIYAIVMSFWYDIDFSRETWVFTEVIEPEFFMHPSGQDVALWSGLGIMAAAAFLLGMYWGGGAVIRHYVLRCLAIKGGYLPWKLGQFLDGAVEFVLMRRVGGGYIFVHPLIQDYFASRAPQQQCDAEGGGEGNRGQRDSPQR